MRCKFAAEQASFLPALIIPHWIFWWWESLRFCLLNCSSILFKSYFNGHTQFWLITSCSLIYFCQKKKFSTNLYIFQQNKTLCNTWRILDCMKHFVKYFRVKKHENALTSGNLKSFKYLKFNRWHFFLLNFLNSKIQCFLLTSLQILTLNGLSLLFPVTELAQPKGYWAIYHTF